MTAPADVMICAGTNDTVNIDALPGLPFQCDLASVVRLDPEDLREGFGFHFPNPGSPAVPPPRRQSRLTFVNQR